MKIEKNIQNNESFEIRISKLQWYKYWKYMIQFYREYFIIKFSLKHDVSVEKILKSTLIISKSFMMLIDGTGYHIDEEEMNELFNWSKFDFRFCYISPKHLMLSLFNEINLNRIEQVNYQCLEAANISKMGIEDVIRIYRNMGINFIKSRVSGPKK